MQEITRDNTEKVFIVNMIKQGSYNDTILPYALSLIEKVDYYHGTVMIIPQAYIKADNMINRYPGYTASNGAKYNKALDLNRNFPGKADGTETEKIAYAIAQEVENFDADYIIDLHESRSSASSSFFEEEQKSRLGDLLIYGNSWTSLFTQTVIEDYNAKLEDVPEEIRDLFTEKNFHRFQKMVTSSLFKEYFYFIN